MDVLIKEASSAVDETQVWWCYTLHLLFCDIFTRESEAEVVSRAANVSTLPLDHTHSEGTLLNQEPSLS